LASGIGFFWRNLYIDQWFAHSRFRLRRTSPKLARTWCRYGVESSGATVDFDAFEGTPLYTPAATNSLHFQPSNLSDFIPLPLPMTVEFAVSAMDFLDKDRLITNIRPARSKLAAP
jgi:hypothetical protein